MKPNVRKAKFKLLNLKKKMCLPCNSVKVGVQSIVEVCDYLVIVCRKESSPLWKYDLPRNSV